MDLQSFPSSASARARRNKRAAFVAVLLLDLVITLVVARQIVAYRDYPFDTDEAFHAGGGLSLALDLRAGDWRAFIVDSYWQSAYPPAFSWLEAPAFLLFGASPLVARLSSLACSFAAALVIYAIGLELDPTWGWLIGLIAAALTLTAQTILTYAGMAMLEVPGLLISLAALWAYVRALKQPVARRLVLVSLLLVLTMLVKYPYGTVLVPTVLLMELVRLFGPSAVGSAQNRNIGPGADEERPQGTRLQGIAWRWGWLFGPFAVAMAVWFSTPAKIAAFFEYANSQPQQVALLSAENLLYYPRSIAFHYAPSPLWGVLFLAALVWAALRWHDESLRLFLVYFVVGMLVMTLKLQKHPRFIATIAPAAFVPTGALLAWLAACWHENWSRARAAMIAVSLALAVCAVSAAPVLFERFAAFPSLMQVHYQPDPQSADLAGWIAAQVPAQQRFYLVNPWDQFSAPALEWYRGTHDARPSVRLSDVFVPSVFLKKAKPENVEELWREFQASNARYVVALEGGPEGDQVWPAYAEAMADRLRLVAQQEFPMQQWRHDVVQWVKRSLLTRDGLERAKENGRYTMHIRATVYEITGAAGSASK